MTPSATPPRRQKPLDLGEFEMACDVVIRADFPF
jgi:hypothetical protein